MAASKSKRKKPAPSMPANGDCYEAAFNFMMDQCMFNPSQAGKYTLVHAEVMGQGPIEGVTFGHAFVVKDGNTVIDRSNGRNIELPKNVYYAIGRIYDIGNIHEYTWEDARKIVSRTGHYGPWGLKTGSGL